MVITEGTSLEQYNFSLSDILSFSVKTIEYESIARLVACYTVNPIPKEYKILWVIKLNMLH